MSVSRDYPRNRPRLLPRRRQTGTELDLKDLQGNLVRGYTYPVGAYVFVGITDAARGRAWLRGLLDDVTTAEPWDDGAPETTLNLSFTYTGLPRSGSRRRCWRRSPRTSARAWPRAPTFLGDVGDSAPEHWEAGLGTGEAHVLVTLYARRRRDAGARPGRAGGDASTTPSRSSTSSARRPCPRAATTSASRTASPSRR